MNTPLRISTNHCTPTREQIADQRKTLISVPLAILFFIVWVLCMCVPDEVLR